jgi:predicted O-linked N-acetylglucosamine transferase (SPINDLY family)
MRILNAVPGSVRWLISRNSIVVNNLRAESETRGIDPQRLNFAENLPLDEHLARYRAADLFLDTLPYNAHTTASDALWAGVPVLTQIGKSFPARVAASLLNTVGLQELITHSQDEYEAKAIQLSRDTDYLASLKNTLEQRRHDSPLFDGKLFARHLEKAYTHMHALRLAGQPAQDFDVNP